VILREIVETVALFAIVFVVARFAIGNYSILGQSMEPNYHQDERLLVAAQASSSSSASATLFSVLGAVEDFAGSRGREDDVSLIVVHRA